MPRRKKTATVSDTPEAVARNEQARPAEPAPPILQPSVAEGFEEPTAPGDAAEPDATGTAPAEQHPAAGPVPHMVWARIEGGRDRPVGIKVETEAGRRPGIAHPRTLIRFRDDLLPTPDEKQRLKDARFKFCPDVGAWGQQKSAASLELAKRLATELARGRGDDGVGLYV